MALRDLITISRPAVPRSYRGEGRQAGLRKQIWADILSTSADFESSADIAPRIQPDATLRVRTRDVADVEPNDTVELRSVRYSLRTVNIEHHNREFSILQIRRY